MARDEFLDQIGDAILRLVVEHQMVHAWQLVVLGARNLLSDVPPRRNRDQRITRTMKDHGGYANRGQQVTDIDLVVGAHQGENR